MESLLFTFLRRTLGANAEDIRVPLSGCTLAEETTPFRTKVVIVGKECPHGL
jgi:hypothetical protein